MSNAHTAAAEPVTVATTRHHHGPGRIWRVYCDGFSRSFSGNDVGGQTRAWLRGLCRKGSVSVGVEVSIHSGVLNGTAATYTGAPRTLTIPADYAN